MNSDTTTTIENTTTNVTSIENSTVRNTMSIADNINIIWDNGLKIEKTFSIQGGLPNNFIREVNFGSMFSNDPYICRMISYGTKPNSSSSNSSSNSNFSPDAHPDVYSRTLDFTDPLDPLYSNDNDGLAYIIFDKYDMDLEDYIYNTPWEERKKHFKSIYIQLVNGLNHLRQHGVYHADVKPSNIFYTNGIVGYGDFGLSSRLAGNEHGYPHGYTVGYKPPEHWLNPTYDCYCLGLTMLEYITRDTWAGVPFDVSSLLSMNIDEVDDIKNFVEQHSDIIDEIMGFLEVDEEIRITIGESAYCKPYLTPNLSYRSPHIDSSLITAIGSMVDDTEELILAYDCLNRYIDYDFTNDLLYDIDDIILAIVSLVKNFATQTFNPGNAQIQLYVLQCLKGIISSNQQDPMLTAFQSTNLEQAVQILVNASKNNINMYKNTTKKMAKLSKLENTSLLSKAIKWIFQ